MPSLYDLNSNANVRVSNSTSLYQNSGNVNIGVGGAQQIITYFDNNGNVNFALDPATGFNTIKAYFVGTSGGGSTYSNANVAAYLITNTGNVQAGNLTVLGNLNVLGNTITTYTANLVYGTIIANGTAAASSTTTGALQSYGGLGVRGDIWGLTVNTNNIYYANGQPYLGATIAALQSNAASQAVDINALYANAATQATSIVTLTANAATQAGQINTINANLGSYQTWANATFSVSSYGNANVAAYLPTFTGNLTAGNIFTDNYRFANGVNILSTVSGGSGTYSNANVAAFLPTYGGTINSFTIFNDSGFAIQGRDYTQMQFTNGVTPPVSEYDIGVGAWFYIDAGGGVFQSNTTGNLKTITYGHDATITAGGNVTAPYFIGDGSQLTNLPIQTGTYSNANVASYLPTYSGSLENSSSIINLVANAATQATAINTLTANAATQAGQIAVIDANLGTATTNITTLFGNAATQTGQIQTLDANLGTATTNITTLFANAATQATSINTLTANAATQSIAIASLATGANANTAAYLPGYTGDLNNIGNITVTGSLYSNDITSSDVYVQGNAIITGNLTVLGNTTTINSNTVTTNDKNITVANNVTVVSQLDGAGLDVGQNSYATWRYNYLSDSWQSNLSVTPTTDVTKNLGASNLRWNTVYAQTLNSATIDTINANLGAYQTYANANAATQATSINTINANLGAYQIYANANAATQAGKITTLQSQVYTNANVLNYLSGGTYGGDIQALSGVVTASAINSTGALSASSYVQAGAGLYSIGTFSGSYSDGIVVDYTTGNGRISVGANDALTFYTGGVGTTPTLVIQPSGNVTTGGNVNANYFVGDGSALTNVPFNGNLKGSTLIDSVRGRVFANAYPESQGNIYVGGATNILQTFSNVPAYIGGALQPQPNGTMPSQTFGFITAANVGLQSAYSAASNRTTTATNMYVQVTPVTANVMLNQDRFRGHGHSVELINAGKTWGTMGTGSVSSTNMVAATNVLDVMGYGELNHGMATAAFVQNVPWNGSSNLQYATGYYAGILQVLNAGSNALPSNIAYARLYGGSMSATANLTITNAIGLHTPSAWWGSTGVTNKYVVLNEDVNSVIQTNGNLTSTGANVTLSGFLTTTGSSLQGSPGATQTYSGNVVYQSNPPYNVTFFSNVIMGQTTSTNLLRGTTKVQGNILFDSPYYETVNTGYGSVSGTLTIDTGLANTFKLTLVGDITLNTSSFTNIITGKSITLILTQDATGGRILSSNMKFAGGINTLSSAAGAIDVMNIYYDGTNYLASLVKGYV